uniref:Gnk2-homologous domain-containing protein n=1 Tax=Leersia perrieri TaxID=77586 RepID=A0A0D9WZU7_9ORYZ
MTRATILLLVLALIAPPLAAAAIDAAADDNHGTPIHWCGTGRGQFNPNSSYESNLRHLAATLPAMVNESSSSSSSSSNSTFVSVLAGERPDMIASSAFCNSSSGSGCAACVARAFRYARWLCGYSRHAVVDLHACRVSYRVALDVFVVNEHTSSWWTKVLIHDFPMMVAFQVIGVAWVLFLFLMEWRDGKSRRAQANRLP